MEAFIHGFILAFGLILPLGIQNLFVFNQGASQPSLWRALPVVVTAALCDTALILLAILGVSLVIMQFAWLKILLLGVGFIFLLYMGWATWNSQTDRATGDVQGMPPVKQILFALSVSLLNPHAILDTVGVIGTGALNYTGSERIYYAVACILVSWVWFSLLAVAGRVMGTCDPRGRWLRLLNRLSALFIWAAALYIGYSAVR